MQERVAAAAVAAGAGVAAKRGVGTRSLRQEPERQSVLPACVREAYSQYMQMRTLERLLLHMVRAYTSNSRAALTQCTADKNK